MKKRANLYEKFRNTACKALYLNTSIHILDNDKVVIENCKRILECNDILISVKTRRFVVSVWGNNLKLSDFKIKSVIVEGKISSVELEEKGGKSE